MTKMINVHEFNVLKHSGGSQANDLGELVGQIEVTEVSDGSEVSDNSDVSVGNGGDVSKRKTVQTMEMKFQKIKEAMTISIQDRGLRQSLASYNFDEERFLEGANLVGKVEAIILELGNIRAQKLNATRNAQLKRKQAYDTFIRFRKVGRIAFENDPRLRSILLLHKPVSKTYAIWLIQAKAFYDTVLNYREVVAEYAEYKVTLDQLEEGKRQVREAENEVTVSVEITARAQTKTSEKNRDYRALLDWWSEFKTIVRIVLKKNPLLLQKSEILVLKRTGAKKAGTHPVQGSVNVPIGEERLQLTAGVPGEIGLVAVSGEAADAGKIILGEAIADKRFTIASPLQETF